MLFPIFLIVSISISTALILDYIKSLHLDFLNFYVLLGLFVVLSLNVFKFIIWNFLHKRYDLSSTYPLTAIYFPIIYVISIFKGEINMNLISLFAISLIFGGVYLILKDEKKEEVLV